MADSLIEQAIGTIDGANRDFSVSVAYFPGTLFVYWNGKLQPKTNTTFGWIETGGVGFRLNSAPVVGDDIHCYYQTEPPTPGAFVPPPEMLSATDLKPRMSGTLNLVPRMISAEEV